MIDQIINGIFTGIGTGTGVIIAELFIRHRIEKHSAEFQNQLNNIKRQIGGYNNERK
jgi:hypothetical protein